MNKEQVAVVIGMGLLSFILASFAVYKVVPFEKKTKAGITAGRQDYVDIRKINPDESFSYQWKLHFQKRDFIGIIKYSIPVLGVFILAVILVCILRD